MLSKVKFDILKLIILKHLMFYIADFSQISSHLLKRQVGDLIKTFYKRYLRTIYFILCDYISVIFILHAISFLC